MLPLFSSHKIVGSNSLTPSALHAHAAQLKAIAKKGNGDNSEITYLAKSAERTALHLENIPEEERLTFGMFACQRINDIHREGTITIPKGSSVYSTKYDDNERSVTSKRDNTVIIESFRHGGIFRSDNDTVDSTQIHWIGQGGYFYWIRLDDTPDIWEIAKNQAYVRKPICEHCGQGIALC